MNNNDFFVSLYDITEDDIMSVFNWYHDQCYCFDACTISTFYDEVEIICNVCTSKTSTEPEDILQDVFMKPIFSVGKAWSFSEILGIIDIIQYDMEHGGYGKQS